MTVNILKIEWSHQVCAMQKYQGYFQLRCNLVLRFDFEKKTKIYDVDSLTALKTWISQEYQNIKKISC